MSSINHDLNIQPISDSNLEIEDNSCKQAIQSRTSPFVSFCIPVRNANEKYLRQLLDSLIGQTLQDIEIVICDNASDDKITPKICQEYVSRDQRIRYHQNSENIGQIGNFNKVLEIAQGKYVRWIGADDWLEPDYASRCVEILETNEQFIGVSTYQDFTHEDGYIHYREYKGENLDSPVAYKRLRRLMWFFNADYGFCDPVYTIMRREVLLQTNRFQLVPSTDQVFAFEVISLGAFTHIPACLAHRRWQPFHKISKKKLYRRYGGEHYQKLQDPFGLRRSAIYWSIVQSAAFSNGEKNLCFLAIVGFTMTTIRKKIYFYLRAQKNRALEFLSHSTPDVSA